MCGQKQNEQGIIPPRIYHSTVHREQQNQQQTEKDVERGIGPAPSRTLDMNDRHIASVTQFSIVKAYKNNLANT